MSVNSSISHPRLTRGSYTSYFTLQISNTFSALRKLVFLSRRFRSSPSAAKPPDFKAAREPKRIVSREKDQQSYERSGTTR